MWCNSITHFFDCSVTKFIQHQILCFQFSFCQLFLFINSEQGDSNLGHLNFLAHIGWNKFFNEDLPYTKFLLILFLLKLYNVAHDVPYIGLTIDDIIITKSVGKVILSCFLLNIDIPGLPLAFTHFTLQCFICGM